MTKKICIVYTHHKLGDLIWQLPYIKAISEHHKIPTDLIVREKTQAKIILQDLSHLNDFYYNDFRKGFFYWIDVIKLFWIFLNNKYDYVYILDKVNKPAIAARLAGIKNIIGTGIRNQKKWLTTKKYLSEEDWKLNYSEQSQKLLSINGIKINDIYPNIIINIKNFETNNKDLLIKGKKIAFGVDSFEDYRIWYEENFAKLAELFIDNHICEKIYLICGPNKAYIAEKIIKLSRYNCFIDCSKKDLSGVIFALKQSNFFVGNNSGPLNLSSALGIKSFGLVANGPVSELKYSKIIPITPDDYKDNIWIKDRKIMNNLKVENVFKTVIDKIK